MTLEQILTFAKLNGTLLTQETWAGKEARRDKIELSDGRCIVIRYHGEDELHFEGAFIIGLTDPPAAWVDVNLADIEDLLYS